MIDNIVVDSCVDFNEGVFGAKDMLVRVPFKISIDNHEIVDDKRDQTDLAARMKASRQRILTACPSPNDFFHGLKEHAANYIITISSKLSASFESAMLAKSMLLEHAPDSVVHIFDSMSASAGESLVAMKLNHLLEENLNPERLIERMTEYIANLTTLFVLDSMDNLVKNGRISSMKAVVGTLLQIVPIMGSNYHGEIELKEQVRGKQKAIKRLIEIIGETVTDAANTVLAITHSNAQEKAEFIKTSLLSKYPFKDIIIFEASGLSTVYMDAGGIVLAF